MNQAIFSFVSLVHDVSKLSCLVFFPPKIKEKKQNRNVKSVNLKAKNMRTRSFIYSTQVRNLWFSLVCSLTRIRQCVLLCETQCILMMSAGLNKVNSAALPAYATALAMWRQSLKMHWGLHLRVVGGNEKKGSASSVMTHFCGGKTHILSLRLPTHTHTHTHMDTLAQNGRSLNQKGDGDWK